MQKDDDLGKFTDELLKRGAQGKVEKGTLDGIASLDELLGLPANVLVSKTTMLPSDLLFEFNKADLRESAKVGLMKLALLMDRNPTLYCWIEGHADLIGSDAFNQQLSMKRADAVKTYLVKSLRMDGDKIIPRGFGKSHPLVKGGTANEQAPNRRVEIRMRQTPPPKDQPAVAPPDEVAHPAQVVHPNPPAPPAEVVPPTLVSPPKAVLVTPRRALPVEEEVAPPVATPRAEPVDPDSLLPPGE
jgi:outer membrane protein OmpA-like peptidoglycan-associated protein